MIHTKYKSDFTKGKIMPHKNVLSWKSKNKGDKTMREMTQDQIIIELQKRRFTWKHKSYDAFEDGETHYMSRRNPKIRAITQLVEVDPNGLCNGVSLDEFLKTI